MPNRCATQHLRIFRLAEELDGLQAQGLRSFMHLGFWVTYVSLLTCSYRYVFPPPQDNTSLAFRYYDLALLQCNSQSSWTIHGLWPDYNQSSWPQYCYTPPPPPVRDYDDLIPAMCINWTSCQANENSDRNFWRHEYLRHGTCAQLGSPSSFFQTTLCLYDLLTANGTLAQQCQNVNSGSCRIRLYPPLPSCCLQ